MPPRPLIRRERQIGSVRWSDREPRAVFQTSESGQTASNAGVSGWGRNPYEPGCQQHVSPLGGEPPSRSRTQTRPAQILQTVIADRGRGEWGTSVSPSHLPTVHAPWTQKGRGMRPLGRRAGALTGRDGRSSNAATTDSSPAHNATADVLVRHHQVTKPSSVELSKRWRLQLAARIRMIALPGTFSAGELLPKLLPTSPDPS